MVCTGVGIDLIDGGETGIVVVVGADVVDEEDEVCGVTVTDVSNVDETELVVDDVLDSGDVVELVEEDEEDTVVGNVKGVDDVDDVVDDSFDVVCVDVCVIDVVKLGVDAEVVLTVIVIVEVNAVAVDVVEEVNVVDTVAVDADVVVDSLHRPASFESEVEFGILQ